MVDIICPYCILSVLTKPNSHLPDSYLRSKRLLKIDFCLSNFDFLVFSIYPRQSYGFETNERFKMASERLRGLDKQGMAILLGLDRTQSEERLHRVRRDDVYLSMHPGDECVKDPRMPLHS